ncbi:hypothetical protein QAD02_000336 [Eretmocerus hayati]|uniref:Uncharacterized protein n=1 Tax=Eretmocerus hayati TaxID=131215 RepID=A0ACC2ND65_9HYME|nr:hypothetical protein QAD02_000336 [Eretmocerus hayati]
MKFLVSVAVLFATACNCQEGYFEFNDEEDITDEKLVSYVEELDKLQNELGELRINATEMMENLAQDLENYPVVKIKKEELMKSKEDCQNIFYAKLNFLEDGIRHLANEYMKELFILSQQVVEVRAILKDALENGFSDEDDYSVEPISETVKSVKNYVNKLIVIKKILPYGNGKRFLQREDPDVTYGINEAIIVPVDKCLNQEPTNAP